VKLGKAIYGRKWHILREDGNPLCGYMSFSWAVEHEEIEVEDIKGFEMCRGCMVKVEGKAKRVRKKRATVR